MSENFTYEFPQGFLNHITQYLQQKNKNTVSRSFNNCCFKYEDLGLAYYVGIKGDNWNKRAVVVTMNGDKENIDLLKRENKILSSAISYALHSQMTGLVLKEVIYLSSDNIAHVQVGDKLEQKFIEISTRKASFDNMSTDEKLAEINNLIEHLLKKDGDFKSLRYDGVCFDYVTDEDVKNYRHRTQCFRHSSEKSLQERNSYTDEQKFFLIDYGIMVVRAIHALINDFERR